MIRTASYSLGPTWKTLFYPSWRSAFVLKVSTSSYTIGYVGLTNGIWSLRAFLTWDIFFNSLVIKYALVEQSVRATTASAGVRGIILLKVLTNRLVNIPIGKDIWLYIHLNFYHIHKMIARLFYKDRTEKQLYLLGWTDDKLLDLYTLICDRL